MTFFKKTTVVTVAGMLLVATPFVASAEGLSLTPYFDQAGVLTIWHGETEGVTPGQKETKETCSIMMRAKLAVVGGTG